MKYLLWDHTVLERGPEGSSDRLTAEPILSHLLRLSSTPPSADCWCGQMGRVGREVPYWGHPVTTRVCRWIAFTYRVMLIVCANVWSGSWQVRLDPVHRPGSGVRLSLGEASVGCWDQNNKGIFKCYDRAFWFCPDKKGILLPVSGFGIHCNSAPPSSIFLWELSFLLFP